MKDILFIIDMQNDFASKEGSLYVKGANNDVNNLCSFIEKYGENISHIVTSQDRHYEYHICHPKFWLNENNEHPEPYTEITERDFTSGKFRPYDDSLFIYMCNYFNKLTNEKKTHTIWPYHCVSDYYRSELNGWHLHNSLVNSISKWMSNNIDNTWVKLFKGENPYTEQYSVFTPFCDIKCYEHEKSDNLITFNRLLSKRIDENSKIFIAGEAQTHCVKETLNDFIKYFHDYVKNLVILTDCMSPITVNGEFVIEEDEVYKKIIELGGKITTTKQYFK